MYVIYVKVTGQRRIPSWFNDEQLAQEGVLFSLDQLEQIVQNRQQGEPKSHVEGARSYF